jgi:hypothetical protein
MIGCMLYMEIRQARREHEAIEKKDVSGLFLLKTEIFKDLLAFLTASQ